MKNIRLGQRTGIINLGQRTGGSNRLRWADLPGSQDGQIPCDRPALPIRALFPDVIDRIFRFFEPQTTCEHWLVQPDLDAIIFGRDRLAGYFYELIRCRLLAEHSSILADQAEIIPVPGEHQIQRAGGRIVIADQWRAVQPQGACRGKRSGKDQEVVEHIWQMANGRWCIRYDTLSTRINRLG